MIPVIDLFAGPGGLGEGFSSLRSETDERAFRIALSVEMERNARETLKLRSFYRQFERDDVPDAYYQCLSGRITRAELYADPRYQSQAAAADSEAMCAELGSDDEKIDLALRSSLAANGIDLKKAPGKRRPWVLIGGPPCQAYSLVGRSRMRGADPRKYAKDPRHKLYLHYLRIIAQYEPAVFVMENVKGILSSKLKGKPIFSQILRDLKEPGKETGICHGGREISCYDVYPCVDYSGDVTTDSVPEHEASPEDFIVRSEYHGIPQRRHRVILIGVRKDLARRPKPLAYDAERLVPIQCAIGELPGLRSKLSGKDEFSSWEEAIGQALRPEVIAELDSKVIAEMERQARRLKSVQQTGAEFSDGYRRPQFRPDWFYDKRMNGLCNHVSRGHIGRDLQRYFFAACFSAVHGCSPKLTDFPRPLWPEHNNVSGRDAGEPLIFADRFRVQVREMAATTVTSHISKDGHYFIHYDPAQSRSLTVREAARLQTFPDNYFFTGPRTSQYQQVGNAVPPLLASQIARQILVMLSDVRR